MLAKDKLKIRNFGKVNANLYRGGQPKDGEYYLLRSIGVSTVVDLRDDAEKYARRATESCGMSYINLPLSDREMPPPEFPQIFFDIVNNKNSQVVYFHCHGGRHRAGAMSAAYRLRFDDWSLKRTMEEVKSYDLPWWRWLFGHGVIKEWIKEYAASLGK